MRWGEDNSNKKRREGRKEGGDAACFSVHLGSAAC